MSRYGPHHHKRVDARYDAPIGEGGAPTLSLRLDPACLAWVRRQEGTIRSVIEGLIRRAAGPALLSDDPPPIVRRRGRAGDGPGGWSIPPLR